MEIKLCSRKKKSNKIVKKFKINIFDILNLPCYKNYDLENIKIKKISNFCGDVILEAVYTEIKL